MLASAAANIPVETFYAGDSEMVLVETAYVEEANVSPGAEARENFDSAGFADKLLVGYGKRIAKAKTNGRFVVLLGIGAEEAAKRKKENKEDFFHRAIRSLKSKNEFCWAKGIHSCLLSISGSNFF